MNNKEEREGRKCPKCGSEKNQMNSGFTAADSQRCLCGHCKCKYTLNPKPWAYSEEKRQLAIKEFYMGTSGRGVGKIHRMSKANVFRWIADAKKNHGGVDKSSD